MTPDELDTRVHDAAEAARTSVLRVANVAHPVGPKRDGTIRRLVIAGVTCSLFVLGMALLAANRGGDSTNVSTQPATGGGPKELSPALPMAPSGLVEGGISSIATGTGADGGAWSLYLGGPEANLCLSVKVPGLAVEPGTCAGAPPGGSSRDADYRPLLFNDTRTSTYVFGRMPTGVEDVEAESSSGTVIGRASVIPTAAGLFYVAEVDDAGTPVAVRGRRAQAAPVRYELAPGVTGGRDSSAFWLLIGMVLVLTAPAYLWRRSRRARSNRRTDAVS